MIWKFSKLIWSFYKLIWKFSKVTWKFSISLHASTLGMCAYYLLRLI